MSYNIKIELIKIFKETYLAVCLIFKGIGMLSMINKNIFVPYPNTFPIRFVLYYVTLRKAIAQNFLYSKIYSDTVSSPVFIGRWKIPINSPFDLVANAFSFEKADFFEIEDQKVRDVPKVEF